MTDTTPRDTRRTFNSRALAAAMMGVSGIALPISGFANHALQLDALTGPRHAWMAAHTSLGALFTLFAAWHVVLNWRPLWRSLRGVAGRARPFSREALVAIAIVLATTAIAAGHALLPR